jgi:hypothetical protein
MVVPLREQRHLGSQPSGCTLYLPISRLLHILSEFCDGLLKALTHQIERCFSQWVMNLRIAVLAHPKLKGSAYIPSFPPERVDREPGISQGFITVITDFEKFLVLHMFLTSQRLTRWLRIFKDEPAGAIEVIA